MPTQRMLLVDDNDAIRSMFGSLLKVEDDLAGWELIALASGTEALEWTATHRCDLVVLDFMMPDIDGIDVAAALRRQGYLGPMVLWSSAGPQVPYEDAAELDMAVIDKADIWGLLDFIRANPSES